MNFKRGAEKLDDIQTLDANNPIFWQKLAETLEETLKMLKKTAEQEGIDLDSIAFEEDEESKKGVKEKAVVHILSHMAMNYAKSVNDRFNSINSFDLKHNGSQEDVIGLEESVKVIRWYQNQIYVKLKRAIKSQQRENSTTSNDYPDDSEGSAKVALIGIDRSIGAWGEMRNHFLDQEGRILNFVKYLDRLRRRIENEFLKARSFIRPGFDETN